MSLQPTERTTTEPLPTQAELQQIATALRGLRFGSVHVIVQDGVVVQIDRVEKRRVRHARSNGSTPS
jgi:hypothetical protein